MEKTEYKKLSETCIEYICDCCDNKYILKPCTPIPIDLIPIAANEYISYKLLMFLKGKGVETDIPNIHLLNSTKTEKLIGVKIPSVLIDHLGNTGRLTPQSMNNESFKNIIYPNWVYFFDRWIGRLDGNGDNNLLLTNDKRVIAVDFSMAYHWACGDEKRVKPINFIDVPVLVKLKEKSSDEVKEIIKSLTDKEIHDILFESEKELCPEFIAKTTLASYYTGLCLRRDLL